MINRVAIAKKAGRDLWGLVWPIAVEDVRVLAGDWAVCDSCSWSSLNPPRPQGLFNLDRDGVVLLLFDVSDGAVTPATLFGTAGARHLDSVVVFVVTFDQVVPYCWGCIFVQIPSSWTNSFLLSLCGVCNLEKYTSLDIHMVNYQVSLTLSISSLCTYHHNFWETFPLWSLEREVDLKGATFCGLFHVHGENAAVCKRKLKILMNVIFFKPVEQNVGSGSPQQGFSSVRVFSTSAQSSMHVCVLDLTPGAAVLSAQVTEHFDQSVQAEYTPERDTL